MMLRGGKIRLTIGGVEIPVLSATWGDTGPETARIDGVPIEEPKMTHASLDAERDRRSRGRYNTGYLGPIFEVERKRR